MSAKTGNTPKRKTPKSNKKLKQDKENTHKQEKTTSNLGYDQTQNQKNAQIDDDGDEETNIPDETTTQSFAERLKILNLQSDVSDRLLEPDDSEPGSEDEKEEGVRKMLKPQKQLKPVAQGSTNQSTSINGVHPIIPIASVGSFAQTLTQALKSTDTKLLESCFLQYESKKNKNLIANTIQRLPKSLLHNLIQQLVICLNRKKRGHGDGLTVAPVKRTKALIEWVRQIVIVHMSYLLTIPSLVTQLTTLHASLQKRLNLHTKLLSLHGRLDLVLYQIELKKITRERNNQMVGSRSMNGITPKQTKSSSVSKNEPFKYIEGQSSDSEAHEEEDGLGKSKEGERNSSGDDDDDDDDDDEDTTDDEDENGDGDGSNHPDEGSVEEVVLGGSGSSDENSDGSDQDENGEKLGNQFDDLLDLEAEESLSELGDHAEEDSSEDEDEDEDEDEEDDSMDGFIDDGTEGSQGEDDSDSE